MMQRIEKTFAGRPLVIETGRMAKQAAGSALVQFGETQVLAAVTVSENQSPLPFFPLTVEYRAPVRGGQDSRRIHQARGSSERCRNSLGAHRRSLDPTSLPGRV